MPNKCALFRCNSNKNECEKRAAFRIPEEKHQKQIWLKFLNRKDLSSDVSFIYICELHFEEKFLNRSNKKRVRLIKTLNPVPSIQPQFLRDEMPTVLPTIKPPRKPPIQRIFRPDEIESGAFKKLSIASFSDIN